MKREKREGERERERITGERGKGEIRGEINTRSLGNEPPAISVRVDRVPPPTPEATHHQPPSEPTDLPLNIPRCSPLIPLASLIPPCFSSYPLSLSLSLSSSLSSPLPLSLNSSFPTSHKFTSINLQFEYGDERPFPASKTVLAHIQREIRTKVSLYFLTRLSRISLVTPPFGNRWKYCITSGESLIFIPSPLHR